jgi:hypothetical protein
MEGGLSSFLLLQSEGGEGGRLYDERGKVLARDNKREEAYCL